MQAQQNAKGRLASLIDRYETAAGIALNTLFLLVLANVAVAVLLALYNHISGPIPSAVRDRMERLLQVYPGWAAGDIEEMLTETWTRGYVYAPFVQHREGAFGGRFVNVDPNGFRLSRDQGPWPPDRDSVSIFVFGGSTTFGYGVADSQTIPSFLQETLSASGCGRSFAVYNFGRGNYYSEQEQVLFATQLAAGLTPDVAVFVDGLNEWKDAPKFTARLDYFMSESKGQLVGRALKSLPLVEAAKVVRSRFGRREEATQKENLRHYAEQVVERWLRSKRLIGTMSREFDVLPIFVWQPVPTYRYDLNWHLFAAESEEAFARPSHEALRHGYAAMDRMRVSPSGLESAGDFLWLADMQQSRRDPLYVDAAHYSARFSRDIAVQIADVISRKLGCGPSSAVAE